MNDWKYYTPKFECDELNYDLLTFAPWSGHRNFVYDIVGAFEPNSIVELGSHYGCSAFTFAQAVKDFELNTKCILLILGKAMILQKNMVMMYILYLVKQ